MPVVYSRKRLRALRDRAEANSLTTDDQPPEPVSPSETFDPRPAPTKRRRRKLIQTHLDVGQRDLSARQCAECGMVYAPGAVDDNDVHARHHATFLKRRDARLPFPGWMGERVVASLHSGRLVAVKACDVAPWKRRVAGVDAFVSERLGGQSVVSALQISEPRWLAILFIADRLVEAYALAELVTHARDASVSADGIATVNDVEGDREGLRVEGTLCGIRKIWVASTWRRKGIASAIVDAARVNLLYGHVIDSSKVAFTATTPAGSKFAASYAKKCDQRGILIY